MRSPPEHLRTTNKLRRCRMLISFKSLRNLGARWAGQTAAPGKRSGGWGGLCQERKLGRAAKRDSAWLPVGRQMTGNLDRARVACRSVPFGAFSAVGNTCRWDDGNATAMRTWLPHRGYRRLGLRL